MRVMVTGGAGFIGSHIVDDLVARGHQVVVYDNFSTGLDANLVHHAGAVEVIRGDILDQAALTAAMHGCEIVSHQAAQLEIFLSIRRPEDDLRQNTIGTLNVLRAAKESGVRKVINASSACVYGQTTCASRETDDPTPNWAYGVSKLAAEKYGRIYSQYEQLPVVSLRYGIVYGEREWYRRVLPIFLKRVLGGHAPVVFGAGDQVRDFVYVGDVVRLHRMCMESSAGDGEVFNVGTGRATTIATLASEAGRLRAPAIAPVFEATEEGQFSRLVPEKKRNAAELKTMLLNIDKARAVYSWEPEVVLSHGLRREYEWARANPDRWQSIRYTVT